MVHDTRRYRVQYWGKPKENKATSHAAKRYADRVSAMFAYVRNVQDAAIGMMDISRIRLEELTDSGWLVVYECDLNFKGEGSQSERMPRRDYIIKKWRQENPKGSKAECAKETGLDRKIVKKWWD